MTSARPREMKGPDKRIRGLDHVRNAGGPVSVVWSRGVIQEGALFSQDSCLHLPFKAPGGRCALKRARPSWEKALEDETWDSFVRPWAACKGPLLSAEYTLLLVITGNESSSDPPPRGGTSGSICEWGWRLKQWPRAACVPWQRFPHSAGSSEKGAKGKTQGDGTPRTWFNTWK